MHAKIYPVIELAKLRALLLLKFEIFVSHSLFAYSWIAEYIHLHMVKNPLWRISSRLTNPTNCKYETEIFVSNKMNSTGTV